ncbi:hypothetical protein JZU56_01270, partial [bacterium]|nr:hypothetical protein [bacterium]
MNSDPPSAAINIDVRNGQAGLCAGCGYFPDYVHSHRCTPGDTCIRAHSGRQIDRFLRNNPEQSEHYL